MRKRENAGRASREQKHLSVLNVGRALAGRPTWWFIRESIQGRGPTSARNVTKPLAAPQTLSLTAKPMRKRRFCLALRVGKAAVEAQLSSNIRESTSMRSPIGVPSVEIASVWCQTSSDINGFI
uniref:Uncharacterized protein n=1 Tax=Athene cunicularia TaxID=194338 RepID=A0A663M5M2_ATHCN